MAAITPLTDTKLLVALHESAFDAAWDAPFFESLLKKSGAQAFGSGDGFILMQPLSGDGQMIEAEILTLAVRPTARRGGLAGRLIVHAQLALAANRIFLEVAADNYAARALYEKFGFDETGRRKAYYKRADGTRQDAVLMQGDFPTPI